MEKKTIGKRIRAAMLDKDIKGKDVAAGLGILPQSYYNALNRSTLTIANAEKIADLLGCDVVLRDRKTGTIY